MKKYNKVELLTGFFMGLFIGISIEAVLIIIYNFFCRVIGTMTIKVTWWMLVPFPLIVGVLMARAIASLHMEDY